jgi:hypothetical protein
MSARRPAHPISANNRISAARPSPPPGSTPCGRTRTSERPGQRPAGQQTTRPTTRRDSDGTPADPDMSPPATGDSRRSATPHHLARRAQQIRMFWTPVTQIPPSPRSRRIGDQVTCVQDVHHTASDAGGRHRVRLVLPPALIAQRARRLHLPEDQPGLGGLRRSAPLTFAEGAGCGVLCSLVVAGRAARPPRHDRR